MSDEILLYDDLMSLCDVVLQSRQAPSTMRLHLPNPGPRLMALLLLNDCRLSESRLYSCLGGDWLLCRWLVLGGVDFNEVVDDDENHGCGAEEDGQPVQIVVADHDGRSGVRKTDLGVDVLGSRFRAGLT
jgi:hypothetical protein